MTRLILLTICAVFSLSRTQGQAISQLSEAAEITVLTCSPGDELYAAFGHSAIRVYDPGAIDYVYNYGTFTFSDDFYLKFAQGKLNYKLSRSDFASFNYEYQMTGRGVMEQVLDLDAEQKQAIFVRLEKNFLPENRYYLYHFFFDNCATRIRDVLEESLGDALVYHSNFAPDSASFRDMIDQYLIGLPWADFGIDMALGAPCDELLIDQENMFLPDYVFSELARATLEGKPLVGETREIVTQVFHVEKAEYDLPVLLAAGLAVLAMFFLFRSSIRRRHAIAWERLLLILFGVLGVAIALLWFATDHTTTKANYNLAWAFPFHLIAALYIRRRPPWLALYFKFFAFAYFAFVLTASIWPQSFHPSAYLFGVSLLAVSWRIAFLPSGKTS